MEQRRAWTREYALALILIVVAAGSGAIITSCGSGGGGGSSDGGLCQQCGDTDGPCAPSVSVSGTDAEALCDPGTGSCDIDLACLRKLGSAQRRCFPNSGRNPELFECDGARAQRNTPTPIATVTPTGTPTLTAPATETPAASISGETPTPTLSPAATLTPTVTPTAAGEVCGNGIVEGDEECDGNQIDNSSCAEDACTCEDFCDDAGGVLSCNANCTLNFSQCANGPCEF